MENVSQPVAWDICGIANDLCGIANDACGIANDACGIANDLCGIANDACGIANDLCGIANDACGKRENFADMAIRASGLGKNCPVRFGKRPPKRCLNERTVARRSQRR
jgi:hypothetical protein